MRESINISILEISLVKPKMKINLEIFLTRKICFFNKMGSEELKNLGLDPDEIRLKLDQIMEWNDPNNKPKE